MQTLFEVATPGLLSCYENRPFWMSWKDGSLHVGEGRTGHQVFIDYHGSPELAHISAIGHSTDNTNGEWDVPLREGLKLLCYI